VFGAPIGVSLCWGGTGANVVALATLLQPWQAVICPQNAHINVDECGAPERFTGCKLIDLPCPDGKLRPEQVVEVCSGEHSFHHVEPAVVSITQSTESGTLYEPSEIAALCEVAHRFGLVVHLDGARLANATAALGGDVRAFTIDAGVDVVTFGGTKAGMMYGEAVLHLRPELGTRVDFLRKQAAQLPSKMRFVAAQFEALLADDLWVRSADRANGLALLLAHRLAGRPGVEVTSVPQVNAVFARLPRPAIERLQAWSFFWDWDMSVDEVRWMTHFATTTEDLDRFVAGIRAAVAR
jgi:threonine aldolase